VADLTPPDPRLELVLGEALRALEHQQALLDNLRSRATLLTTAAALVGAYPLADPSARAAATVLAASGLVGVLVCTSVICVPWWRWRFRTSATALLGAVDLGHTLDGMRRHLAVDFETWLDDNDRRIRMLQWWFSAGLAFLALQICGWAVHLATAGGADR
jgi:hypothetical protein